MDTVGGVLQFNPASSPPVEVPFAAIGGVSVTEQTYRRRNDGFGRHRVEVVRGDGGAALAVAEYDDPQDAEALADWLRQQVASRYDAG